MKGGERMKAFILLFLVCLFIMTCSNPAVDTSYSIKGSIVDSMDSSPIPGAWVKLYDTIEAIPFFSDSTGSYSYANFGGSTSGNLYVGKEGYYTKFRHITNLREDITGIDFQLVPINRK